MASSEAWIWYGHLWLPDNSSAYSASTFPLAGVHSSNQNNYFANQLVLGRMAMLLTEKSSTGNIGDAFGQSQWFLDRNYGPTDGTDLSPLAFNSKLVAGGGPAFTSADPQSALPCNNYNSRVDLASTSIGNFQKKLTDNIVNKGGGTNWWTYLMNGSNGRYQCNPFVAKPMQAVDMAHASPYMLGGCSQFIVEFAGDFLTQDSDPNHLASSNSPRTRTNYGDVQAMASDSQLDFTVTYTATGVPIKQIKWYGMPRSTSGNTTINAANGDVVPLRDWLQNIYKADGSTGTPVANASFERAYPPKTEMSDYASASNGMTVADAQNGYTCAFGPTDVDANGLPMKPKLIRITLTVDDPTGRLPDGQTYQYVFSIP